VLSNLLLVLGTCFLLGGAKYKQQTFNTMVNKASASLLFLASIAIVIPSIGPQLTADISPEDVRRISHGTAILLAFVYLCYLFFQLKTHHSMFVEEDSGEQPSLSLVAAIGMLGAITAVVAVSSEFLTGALQEVSEMSGISQAFLGLIILPIAGNACEHITAIIVAMKNKMDLAIGVALGSSIQIAVFVIPVVVIVGWIIGKPFLLDFDPFLVVMLTLSVIHAFFVSSDGQSNWLMGVQLIGTYILIALLVVYK
jgi:Ca2+:H+ antiporter